MKISARLLSVCCALSVCTVPPTVHGDAALDAAFAPLAGVREHSGRLIVRPKQVSALTANGMSQRHAAQRVQQARARLAPHLLKHHASVDEHIVAVPDNSTPKQFAQVLLASGDYAYVEPDWLVSPAGVSPNDTLYGDQWYLPHVGADWAWHYTQGDPGTVVAVVDTGVDGTHPELAAALVPGYNAVTELAEIDGGLVSDVMGHGTRVAGIVAAAGNNSMGVCGVGWNLSIMPVRVSNSTNGMAHLSDINAGSRWAIEHGAKIANVSYNGVNSASVQTTGEYIRALGGLLIWAVGNGAFHIEGHDHADVIIVGATDASDEWATLSNYGELVDLVAPGMFIRTTATGGGYGYFSGTSYATPIVSGAAALMWSATPALAPEEIEAALLATARDLGKPGEDEYFGAGIIDAFEAVKVTLACPADAVSAETLQPPGDGVVDAADLAFLLSQWGAAEPSLADLASSDSFALPADGLINAADLGFLLGMWGECP